jgi:hypothetical protein
MIFEPKPRLVMSQTITDKIVNHFVANYYLIPYVESKLIDSNVATRKEKGSKYAMYLVKKYINKILINEKDKEIYCLKVDVSKYFYSIDHNILFKMLKKYIYDEDVLNLIKVILNETNKEYINNNIEHYNKLYNVDIPYYRNGKGLSIGAMCSQFLAIFNLNDLDHFIKEQLHCKYYVRYMDDILILDTDKDKLKYYFKVIKEELYKLNLKDNKKSNLYRTSNGFSFLGYKYKISNNKLIVSFNSKTYRRIRKKLKYLYYNDKVLYNKSLASYYGYFLQVKNERSYNFKMKLVDKYISYKNKYPNSIVIIKEGIFYKTFYSDAKILWYLFGYKYINDTVSFGTTPYDKVLNVLNNKELSYVIIDKDKEVIIVNRNVKIYESYLFLSNNSFTKNEIKSKLLIKFNKVLEKNNDSLDKVNDLLDKLLKEEEF